MEEERRQDKYRTIVGDDFPDNMTIILGKQRIVFEKVGWDVAGERKGLRYGENPGMPAALYRPTEKNLRIGDVETIQPGRYLVSDAELVQSGKHPGKTNLTDVDNSLNIMRWLSPDRATVVIIKHNNPCGVAVGSDLCETYIKADLADHTAAFGGAITLNRPVDKDTAKAITENYSEVVAAPEFEPGVMEIFAKKKKLRVMRIGNMDALVGYRDSRVLEFKSLIDGSQVVQISQNIQTRSTSDFIPAYQERKSGKEYGSEFNATQQQLDDVLLALQIEIGGTSNSVLFVKDGVSKAIGVGGQDRVGIVDQAVWKAYRNRAAALAWTRHHKTMDEILMREARRIEEEVRGERGGLIGSALYSDAFFPFRDGVDRALDQEVGIVGQPGGSDRDFESIIACNEAKVPMVFTKSGERSFKH
jgi:phosphoribosylaminoimidazolecarboxamide formyltransferase/IMP cyclohydrolase